MNETRKTKNNVICAIDVNDYDQNVIDLAATYARHFGVEVDLLHVTLIPDPGTAAWPAYVGSPNLLIRDSRKLAEVATKVPDVEVHCHQLSGLPAQEILEFAERNQPKLLVLGTHGRKGLARIFGSVAARVVRNAQCPVMVLRQLTEKETEIDNPLAEIE